MKFKSVTIKFNIWQELNKRKRVIGIPISTQIEKALLAELYNKRKRRR